MLIFEILTKFLKTLLKIQIMFLLSLMPVLKNTTTSILHIHSGQSISTKTIYHIINIILIKTELFSIRYGINQAF